MVLAVISIAMAVTLPLASSVYSQGGNNQSGGNQSVANNASQGIGSAQQLSQALGNNTELLTNNTPIGNPNASTAEKMAAESNATDNQSTLGGNQTSGNQTSGNQTSGNQSNPLKGLVEGIGKLFGNATGK
jgi:type II secretory pathway pseudopilin PulG